MPLTAALLGAPRLLARLEGRDSTLCAMAAAYSLRLLPCLWLEVLNRCAPGLLRGAIQLMLWGSCPRATGPASDLRPCERLSARCSMTAC